MSGSEKVPEHDEFPFLLSLSNLSASARSAPERATYFSVGKKYRAPSIRRIARMIHVYIFLFITVGLNFANGGVLNMLCRHAKRCGKEDHAEDAEFSAGKR